MSGGVPVGIRVGVLSPFVGGDYYGGIIAGANAAASAAGGRIVAFQTLDPGAAGADYCPVPRYPRNVSWQHFDAAIVLQQAVDQSCVRRLQDAGTPVVLVAHEYPDVSVPVVRPDNRAGVREAVHHLVGHGHRRIAFGGLLSVNDVHERYRGYREGLLAHGLEPDPDLFFPAPDNHETGGVEVAARLLEAAARLGRLPATALVVGTDRNALGLLERLVPAGYRVPDDLAVVGFDDLADGWYARPSLSSVHQPLDRIGALAYEQAAALAAGAAAPALDVRVPTFFVQRESCGCPQSGLRITEEQARSQFLENSTLQMTLNTQYELGIELLRTHERDPRAMAWLGRTPALAGCLGLWPEGGCTTGQDAGEGSGPQDPDPQDAQGPDPQDAQGPDPQDPDPQIEVVGTFLAAGGEGLAVGVTTPVSAFPPAGLFDVPDGTAGEIVFVVPVRSPAHDWGLLAAVGRIQDSTPPGREMMNHSGSLLAVALDHDAVLRSLQEQRERLRRAALYDHLTGLPNRTLLLDRLTQTVQRSLRRPDRHFALLFLDLDGFKTINDSRGHAAGDDVLVEVARRLTTVLRRSDTAARLGGDEFVVLLDGLGHPDEADLTAQRVRTALHQPVRLGDDLVAVGVSIGISRSSDGATDAEDLLRRADAAMYRAKTSSRGGVDRPCRP